MKKSVKESKVNSLINNGQVIILILLILVLLPKLVRAESQIIKVGLVNDAQTIKIVSPSGMKLLTSDGYTLSLTDETRFLFKKEDKFIQINNYYFDSDHLQISPVSEEQLLNVAGRNYKGIIKLLNNGQTMTVINKVTLTDYLASVLGSEIDPDWPLETLKAQAVVARTYALRNLNSYASKGYNLSNTIYSQVYKGDHVTTAKVYRAVRETAGEVLTYNGELISAVYHSNAGGKTAKGDIIWGGDAPYLQSVDSRDHFAPHYQWEKEYSNRELKRILATKKRNLVDIKKIALEDVGPSGRPGKVVVEGENKSLSIDSSKFRFWLNLRSTKFSVIKLETGYLFKGNGWGHGVGMSQWGAYQMGKEGYKYQEILTHYYQNTKLVKKDVGGINNEG